MKCDKVFILELEAPDKEWINNKGALINMYNDDHTHKGQFPAVELKNRYVFTDDELKERDNIVWKKGWEDGLTVGINRVGDAKEIIKSLQSKDPSL